MDLVRLLLKFDAFEIAAEANGKVEKSEPFGN